MQNKELDSVKKKIKGLVNKTVDRGCSEHEATVAMEMVGRLLEQYNLSMSEIDMREQSCKTIYIETGRSKRGAVDGSVVALANLFDAIVWVSTKMNGRKSYAFFGTETDLEMIQYLYEVISTAIVHEQEAFKQTDTYINSRKRKSAFISFGHGMAARISYRLSKMKEDMIKDVPASSGTSLIALKGQLIQEEFKNTGINIRPNYSKRRTNNANAYYKGIDAGDRVNLSRPIGGGTNKVSGYLT